MTTELRGSFDLVQFLRDRLDEDEQAARTASPGPWAKRVGYISGGPTGAVRVAQQAQAWNAEHITRHDPARVLAEVEAKLRSIARIENHAQLMGRDEIHGDLLRLLALPYADHPDYRELWRP